MTEESRPPFFQIASDNHAPWIVITSTAFLVYSLLAVGAKIISRLHLTSMRNYDWLIVASAVMAFVQTICIISACKNGLGQPQELLSQETFGYFARYVYSARILFIISMAFAKCSVLWFIMAITPQRSIHYACYGVAGTVAAWTLASVFAIAFQCELPSPWMVEDGKCINTRALELFIGIVNIITDLSLIVIPAIMMGGVQTNISKKWQVMILFGCRILVPAFIIPQMIAYHTDVDLDDYSWTMVSPIIWTAIVMNLSILTACIPSLKGVLDMFKSGTSLFTIPTQYEAELGSSSKGVTSRIKTALSGRLGIGGTRNHSQTGASSASGEWPTRQMKKVQGGHHTSEVSSAGKEKSHLGNIPERSESQRSLTEGAILRTIDYEIVGYEDRGDSRTARGSDHSHSPAEPDDFIRATVK